MEAEQIFDKYKDEYLAFQKVENKLNTRPDLHAFILLNNKFKKDRGIISSSEHDVIYLDVSENEIEQLSDSNILELIRCGVLCDGYGLNMFT